MCSSTGYQKRRGNHKLLLKTRLQYKRLPSSNSKVSLHTESTMFRKHNVRARSNILQLYNIISFTLCLITSFIGLYDVELSDPAFIFFLALIQKCYFLCFDFIFVIFITSTSKCSFHCSDQARKRKPISEMLNLYLFFLWKTEL